MSLILNEKEVLNFAIFQPSEGSFHNRTKYGIEFNGLDIHAGCLHEFCYCMSGVGNFYTNVLNKLETSNSIIVFWKKDSPEKYVSCNSVFTSWSAQYFTRT